MLSGLELFARAKVMMTRENLATLPDKIEDAKKRQRGGSHLGVVMPRLLRNELVLNSNRLYRPGLFPAEVCSRGVGVGVTVTEG